MLRETKICLEIIILALLFNLEAKALTIGPTTKVEIVIVESGTPVQIVESKTVSFKVKTTTQDLPSGVVKRDWGGWVLITPWDWETWRDRLKAFSYIQRTNPAIAEDALSKIKK